MHPKRSIAMALAGFAFSMSAVSAQIPKGWVAASLFRPAGAAGAVEGGILVFNPYDTTQQWSVSGLPVGVTALNSGSEAGGTHMLVRESDGAIVVSETAPGGNTVSIHLITLNGQAVGTIQSALIGTTTGTGRIGGIDWADAAQTQVAFGFDQISGVPGATGTKGIGILDLATMTASALTMTFVPAGELNTCLVDLTNQLAFFTVSGLGSAPISSRLMSLPLGGGTPNFGPTIVGVAEHLGWAQNGDILICLENGSAARSDVYRYSQATLRATPFVTNLDDVRSLTYDEISGGYIGYGELDIAGTATTGYYTFSDGGPETLILTPTATGPGSGAPGAMVRFPIMSVYGTQQPNQPNNYEWLIDPAPGGAPQIGNANFSIQMQGSPAAAVGVIALSQGTGTGLPSPFGNLWIDPAQFIGAVTVTTSPVQVANLPLPNLPALVGLEVFAQAIHIQGTSRLRTTRALQFTITN